MRTPHVGLSLQLDDGFLEATRPLFAAGHVDAIEWTPEIGWGRGMPEWADTALDAYAGAGRLYGHTVALSPLSAKWEPYQDEWLARLKGELARRRYRHVSEHFGWMNAGEFDLGSPLPIPRTPSTARIGCERMQRFRDACDLPVGMENLATVLGRGDVDGMGAFMAELLDACDGFMVLDLHNLYCHAENFGVAPLALLERYPLEHVCELHVSGGSWTHPDADGGERRYRRDTHDGAVPDEVFALIQPVLARCPDVELVVFERIGQSIGDAAAEEGVRRDFLRVRALVEEAARAR